MERETGLEPATTCLEGRNSTTELLPQNRIYFSPQNALCQRGVRASSKTATDLSTLIGSYRLCARAEGKSQKTIDLTSLALRKLKAFLEDNHLPADAGVIGANEIRGFILHLQRSGRFVCHPYGRSQQSGLSELSINSYLRAIRAAFRRWVDEGPLERTPFETAKVPKAPRPVTAIKLQKDSKMAF